MLPRIDGGLREQTREGWGVKMARRKNLPDVVRAKFSLSERLREIRSELYGDRGGSEMARQLGIPVRTWYNYEGGVTVPAEVLLRFIELTGVEPTWLLHGRGERFRTGPAGLAEVSPTASVESLLRTALERLERRAADAPAATRFQLDSIDLPSGQGTDVLDSPPERGDQAFDDWTRAQREGRIIKVQGDAMVPVVADGAQVAYAENDESPDSLDGALVVVWFDRDPVVRWFRKSGAFGLLRVENPDHLPSLQLVDLKEPRNGQRVRRVLWISTPH